MRRPVSMRSLLVMFAVGAAAAVWLGGAFLGAGAPGGDAVVAAQPFTLGDGQEGVAAAACPVGTRAIGGGVGTTGPTTLDNAVGYYLEFSGPQDETATTAGTAPGDVARYWSVHVHNVSGATQDFRVFALCSASSDAVVAVQPVTLGHGEEGHAAAACPAGTRAVGGGVGTTGPATLDYITGYLVEFSGPQDETATTAATASGDVARHWSAHVHNISGATQDFRVFALCSASSDAVVAAQNLVLAHNQEGQGIVTCPTGSRVTGGGVGTTGPVTFDHITGYVVEISGPLDETASTAGTGAGDVARSWFAHLRNVSGASQGFKVLAVCSPDTGSPTSAPRVTPSAPPPRATLATARFIGGFDRRGLTASLVVTGSAGQTRQVRVRLFRAKRLVLSTRRAVRGPTFSLRIRLPNHLLPATYEVALGVDGQPIASFARAALRLRAPTTGIVRGAAISARQNGPPALGVLPRARLLHARFPFVFLPAPGQRISVQWTTPKGSRAAVLPRPRRRAVSSFVRGEDGKYLAAGVWRCTLRVGRQVVSEVGIRLRESPNG